MAWKEAGKEAGKKAGMMTAAGLTAVFLSACIPDDTRNFVPENSHPDLTENYEDLRQRRHGEKPDGESYTPIAPLLACEKNGDDKTPAQATRSLREIQNRTGHGHYEDRARLCEELQLLDILRADHHLSDSELRLQRHFQEDYAPNADYKAWESQRRTEALYELSQNDRLLNLFVGWKRQLEYKSTEEATDQYKLRQEAFQIISDTIRKAYGLGPIPVYLADVPGDLRIGGMYSVNDDFIVINYDSKYNITDSLRSALETLAEEIKHSVDVGMAMQLRDGQIAADDIRAEHAAAVLSNAESYTTPERFWILNFFSYIDKFGGYYEQYVERNAKKYEDTVRHRLPDALYERYENDKDTLTTVPGTAPPPVKTVSFPVF